MEKVYLIIGATSQMGMAYMKRLNELNGKITIIALYYGENSELVELNNELENITMDFVECNLSNSEDVKRVIEYIKEKYTAPTHVLHLAARKFEYVKF